MTQKSLSDLPEDYWYTICWWERDSGAMDYVSGPFSSRVSAEDHADWQIKQGFKNVRVVHEV